MSSEKQQLVIRELETLNEIATTLNESVDVHSALNRALERLVDVMQLETGWIFLHEPADEDRQWGPGFRLVAHCNLPPAMTTDNEMAWHKGCDCQTLCLKGKLDAAYNEVRCSRLGGVTGDRRGLVVHASTPLRVADRTLGILNVAAPTWESFNERNLALLNSVGSQMAVALERARLYDLLQDRRLHEQTALLDFTNQLLSRLDLDELMAYLVNEVRSLLQIDACALLLPDEEDPAYLRFAAASGWRTDPVRQGRRIPADKRSGSGQVMHTQQPIVLEEVEMKDPAPWMDGWLMVEEFRAAAIIPLIADGRSIGALVVDNREPQSFAQSEVSFLQLMANQAAIALEKARLHREEIQRHRLEEELLVARQIQLSMLPPGEPRAPGWEFAMHYEAARQVGGDFYDFFEVPPENPAGQLALVVADVADKGVPAALFMALSRTTIRNVAISDRTPGAALEKANELILSDSQTDLFLTLFYAVLDTEAGQLAYANAGHNPPLWYKAQSGTFYELTGDGLALGVIPDVSIENIEVSLSAGDLLILYTDGVTEAMGPDMDEFGLERLKEAVPRDPALHPQQVVDSIITAIAAHTENNPHWDDLTLFVVRRCLPAEEWAGG